MGPDMRGGKEINKKGQRKEGALQSLPVPGKSSLLPALFKRCRAANAKRTSRLSDDSPRCLDYCWS